jgi:Fe-S-cluster containining protein
MDKSAAQSFGLTPEEKTAFLQSAENVQQAAAKHLSTCHDAFPVVDFVKNLQAGVDRVVDEVVRKEGHVDCRTGCSHCCSAKVEAIAPEIFQIVEELGRRSAAERVEIVERLQAHAATSNDGSAPWSQRKSCPFLIDHLCSIYQVRPAVCRKAHSLDAGKCEAHGSTIPQYLAITLNTEALLKGTSGAYRQLGFDASSLELVRAVLLAMHDPSALSRWYRGEKVFEPAAMALPITAVT